MNKKEFANIFLALSITIFFISIYHFQQTIKNIEEYEEAIKEEIENKIDRDYKVASSLVNANASGEYFQDTKNIIIYTKNREIWNVKKTAIHEICHYIWFEFLNESQRNEWNILYQDSVSDVALNDSEKSKLLTNGSLIFVSEYAEKNELEDFAESCSAFWLEWNKLDFRKELFMKKYVAELI